ncbi:MAG: MFS transporter [Candidatus Gottesmanbacteria bacterium]
MKKILGFPSNVFILSLVSFLNDIGGETIKRTIPLFLTNVLGVKTDIVGLVEGVAEATPQIFQPISGWLSDKFKKRKALVLFGQIIRSAVIFLFWATSWGQVLIVRFLDRSGKGINGAPRDALIAASSDEKEKGRSFSLNRAFDDAGAVFGLVVAGIIVILSQGNIARLQESTFTKIVLLAVIPLILAIIAIVFFVKEEKSIEISNRINLEEKLSPKYYHFLILTFIFSLANSSDGFLVLRAQNIGVSLAVIFFLLALLNFMAAIISVPAGNLSDRIGRKKLLFFGWLIYSISYFGFSQVNSLSVIIVLFFTYGIYMGLAEGVAKALIADLVGPAKRGTAFGIYNLVIGGTLLPASLIAGWLWQAFNPATAFYFDAILSLIAAFGLIFFKLR